MKTKSNKKYLFHACLPLILSGFCAELQAQPELNTPDNERYNRCVTLAERAPDQGINAALEWKTRGGGVPARHCEALALFFAREFGEAAVRLEGIAEDMRIGRGMPVHDDKRATASAGMLADTYGQAANAWLLGGEIVRAESAINQALALVPQNTTLELDLRIDKARIAAAEEDYTLALSELEAVWAIDRRRVDIMLLLASAARSIENYDRAQSALDIYMNAFPEDPSAFLELGNLKDAEGDSTSARRAWLKVLSITETGPDAEAARANLERIDVVK